MNKNNNIFDIRAKVIIIGDSGVGKSCLLLRFCDDKFVNSHYATLGVDFKIKTMEVGGKKLKIQAWDTAGQERFRTITQTFYRGAAGVVLAYSVNDRASFINVESWMKQIKDHANSDICKILIATKSDMGERCVDFEEGKRLAERYGIQFFETSAKEDKNVKEVFECIAKDMITKIGDKITEPEVVPVVEKPSRCC